VSVMLRVSLLSFIYAERLIPVLYAECHYTECRDAQCLNAELRGDPSLDYLFLILQT
jgi:hypothetical protein